jgi:hypothetical protein
MQSGGSLVYVFRHFGRTVHVMACGWRQQAFFEMWVDFYQTSPAMRPEFIINWGGGEVSVSVCDSGLILRSAL